MLLILPKHIDLSINHNPNASCYETVAQHIEHDQGCTTWVSDEERERAIATNEIWEAQWYPDTPVGFHRLAASTLPALLRALEEAADEDPATRVEVGGIALRLEDLD